MPLKKNVGVSRKVADNNYGSRGASVNLEVELDSGLVQQPEKFFERVRQVFRLAQQAVDEELSRQTGSSESNNGHATTNGHHANGTAHHASGNGHRRSSGRKSTASQARALRAIAERQGFDLAAELQTRFGVSEPEELSITEASQTIDALNAAVTNNGASNHGSGTAANANGQRNGNGHAASEQQIEYARQLAKQINGLGVRHLEGIATKMFSKPLVALTTLDASGLIDTLKAIKSGSINLDAALEASAA